MSLIGANEMRTWKYEALLLRVVDGDTIVCDIDLGMKVWQRGQYVRLYGVNAPEMHGRSKKKGQESKAWLEAELAGAPKLWLVTVGYDEHEKFGRVLALVYTKDPGEPDAVNVNEKLVEAGHAVPYLPK